MCVKPRRRKLGPVQCPPIRWPDRCGAAVEPAGEQANPRANHRAYLPRSTAIWRNPRGGSCEVYAETSRPLAARGIEIRIWNQLQRLAGAC